MKIKNINDWLKLHEFNIDEFASFLYLIKKYIDIYEEYPFSDFEKNINITLEEAIGIIQESFDHLNISTLTKNSDIKKNIIIKPIRRCASKKYFTLFNNHSSSVEIFISYNESITDFLKLTHEFSHALNHIASNG
ncbi:MAG: hypothetical protein AAGB12_11135, partial [Pseudomonadota bacterium]